MKPLLLYISISVESYYEKNCWKLLILLRCRKAHSFQTIKDNDLKFGYNKLKTFPYLLYNPRNKPSMSVLVGSVQLIILNNSTSPKMYIKMYLNWFRIYLKDFGLWVFKDMQTLPPPPPSVSFAPVLMKDAQYAESNVKKNSAFCMFTLWDMVIFVLKTANFRWIFTITWKIKIGKIDFSFVSAHYASFMTVGSKLGRGGGGVCISLVGTEPLQA